MWTSVDYLRLNLREIVDRHFTNNGLIKPVVQQTRREHMDQSNLWYLRLYEIAFWRPEEKRCPLSKSERREPGWVNVFLCRIPIKQSTYFSAGLQLCKLSKWMPPVSAWVQPAWGRCSRRHRRHWNSLEPFCLRRENEKRLTKEANLFRGRREITGASSPGPRMLTVTLR